MASEVDEMHVPGRIFVGATGLGGFTYTPPNPLGNYHGVLRVPTWQKRFFLRIFLGREEEYTQRIWESKPGILYHLHLP